MLHITLIVFQEQRQVSVFAKINGNPINPVGQSANKITQLKWFVDFKQDSLETTSG